MQTCPSCQNSLPTNSVFFYCPHCPQQIRCKHCHETLLPNALHCVMCGTPVGEGTIEQSNSGTNDGSSSIGAINTLKFIETNKSGSREIEAALTNEVGISWGGAAIAAIVGGYTASGKQPTGRSAVRDLNQVGHQQLSLLNYEPNGENLVPAIDTVVQLPAVQGGAAEKLKQIFRHNGEQLQLMETRLKAANKLDAARRLTYLVLLYSLEVDGREEIPRNDLNDILKRVGLYDNNTATWIGKSAELISERELVGLRLSGQEQARKVLTEVLDRSVEDKWSLTSGAATRSSKSSTKGDDDSESSAKTSKRKANGFSKDVQAWVTSWKSFAASMNAQIVLQEYSVAEKGCLGLWAIGKVTNDPDIAVSSYKLKQFLYLGLGSKVDERHLERSLQAMSGQGQLIKMQNGFQLLASGRTEVEKRLNIRQETVATDGSFDHSAEV